MRKLKQYLVLAACLFAVAANSQSNDFISNDLDTYIKIGMEKWQVPGLAIVVVKDGQVVKMQGYGVKDIQTKAPVDVNTHFFIASNTKLFTGTALANLELQSKLNLNDPVTKYFPDYKLYDGISTQLVTIRDMLSHRIGTKTFQGDFTFWNSTLSRAEVMKGMSLLKPSAVFRQDYGYCNSCYLTAGEVIPKVIGMSWEKYVQDSILTRLGMLQSFASSNGIETRSKNIATPYTTSYSNKLLPVPFDKWDNLGPAASIVSNVSDLSKWLMFQLDSGRLNGAQLMPWPTLRKTRTVNITTRSFKSAVYPTIFQGYGLGVNTADYNGKQIYWHTGGAAGMVSNVCFVPEEKLGIAILTNNDNQNFFEALRYQVLDAYLGVAFTNRSENMLPAFNKEMDEQLTEIAGWRSRVKGNAPELPLNAYAGVYKDALYGTITVAVKDKDLVVNFSRHLGMTARLTYMDKSEWLMEYNNIEYGIFSTTFSLKDGKVESLKVPMNPFVEIDPYTFRKQ